MKCKLKYYLNIHKPYAMSTKILKYIHNPCILAFKAETSVHESWYIWVRRISKSIFSFVNFVRPLHIFDIVIAREPNHEWGTCFFRGEKTEDEHTCEFEFESLLEIWKANSREKEEVPSIFSHPSSLLTSFDFLLHDYKKKNQAVREL